MPAEDPLEYTQFDTDPPIVEDLEEQDPDTGVWGPMDLTGKDVRLLAEHRRTKRRFGGDADVIEIPPDPDVDGDLGKSRVQYVLGAQDLSQDGDYYYQWEIRSAGAMRTVPPGEGFRELTVKRKLGSLVP